MEYIKKINRILKLLISLSIFLLFLGISYSFFTANISGSEIATTITASGGSMSINYNGGANIDLSGIYPKNEILTTKTFTITGNNTKNIESSCNMISTLKTTKN